MLLTTLGGNNRQFGPKTCHGHGARDTRPSSVEDLFATDVRFLTFPFRTSRCPAYFQAQSDPQVQKCSIRNSFPIGARKRHVTGCGRVCRGTLWRPHGVCTRRAHRVHTPCARTVTAEQSLLTVAVYLSGNTFPFPGFRMRAVTRFHFL